MGGPFSLQVCCQLSWGENTLLFIESLDFSYGLLHQGPNGAGITQFSHDPAPAPTDSTWWLLPMDLWTGRRFSGDSWGGRQFSRIHPPQQVWRGGWSFREEYWPGALENRIDLAICNVRGHLEQQTGGNTYPGFKPPFTMGWGTALSTTKASSDMASANLVETPGRLSHA